MRAVTLVVLLLAPALAWPCSYASYPDVEVVPVEVTPAPAAPDVSVTVVRGDKPCDYDSCSDLGQVSLTVSGANGAAFVGVRIAAGEGAPEGFLRALTDGQVALESRSTLSLRWVDGASREQEPIAFELSVRTIAADGALSEAAIVSVADPGRTATEDCVATSEAPTPPVSCGGTAFGPLLGLGALFARRRRRFLRGLSRG